MLIRLAARLNELVAVREHFQQAPGPYRPELIQSGRACVDICHIQCRRLAQ